MLPHEREMVKRLKDQPFTLLGINSDESRSALQKILKEQNITWPQIYGGPTSKNPIANKWNVHGWPTIYVLDHEGVIRHRDLRDERLENAVVELLKKVPGAAMLPALKRLEPSSPGRPQRDQPEP
jgi:hypothetical protein